MKSYKQIIDDMEWSFSRLACFDRCKYEFYLNYIVKDDSVYPPQQNYYAEVGSYVHKILAMVLSGEMKLEDSLQYYLDNFEDNVFETVRRSTMKKTYELCADYFASEDLKWITDKYDIVCVEKDLHCLIEGYKFHGIIDLLLKDKKSGGYVIVDHKSAQYPFKKNGEIKKNSEEQFNSYKRQMELYAELVKANYGHYPDFLVWNHFKENAGTHSIIKCSLFDMLDTRKWMCSIIERIKNEVEFEPTINEFYCRNLCQFRDSCEYRGADEI